MKRNLMLLTAVVLAAVLLAGCTWPIIGDAVKIEVVNNAKDLIKPVDLAKEYKKGSTVEITFEYTEDRTDEEIEFAFAPKDTELIAKPLDPKPADDENEAFLGGFLVEGKTAKKNITITVSVKEAPENGEE